MEQPLMPGAPPSVSNRLTDWLQTPDEATFVSNDPVDVLIAQEALQIARFVYFRELDLFLLILTNRRIISRLLSEYPQLQQASDQQLTDYTVSATGIHWEQLDIDLSLRGFLREEAVQALRTGFSAKLPI